MSSPEVHAVFGPEEPVCDLIRKGIGYLRVCPLEKVYAMRSCRSEVNTRPSGIGSFRAYYHQHRTQILLRKRA
jgi:hypothetical protein